MIYKVKNFLKIILLLLICVTVILGDCTIRHTSNPLIKPHLRKKIGIRTIEISNSNTFTTIANNQEIIASCDIKFEKPENRKDKRELNISCSENYIYESGNIYDYSSEIYLECALLKWNLYELLEPFDWCPSYMASYILSRPAGSELQDYINVAGICYDTYSMKLSSIYYIMAIRHYRDFFYQYPHVLPNNLFTPRVEIKYVKETFKSKSISYENYDNIQLQHWMKFANYQYNSIIQNPVMINEVYNEISSLLDFQWWPNLRLGNWQTYEEALARHIEKKTTSYEILAGISGDVMAPIKETCKNNYTMKTVIDKSNTRIPLYVWNYLQSRFDKTENTNIVVIGFNSPFNDFYSEKDVVFCRDICDKIDWLKNVLSTFRYSTMGIVFCCSVEEVRSSKRLLGFPQFLTKPIEETTPTPPKKSNYYATTTEPYLEDDENSGDDYNGNDY